MKYEDKNVSQYCSTRVNTMQNRLFFYFGLSKFWCKFKYKNESEYFEIGQWFLWALYYENVTWQFTKTIRGRLQKNRYERAHFIRKMWVSIWIASFRETVQVFYSCTTRLVWKAWKWNDNLTKWAHKKLNFDEINL